MCTKNNALQLYDGQFHTLQDTIKKDPLALIFDQSSVKHVYMDESSVMVASAQHVLNAIWTKAQWWPFV